MTRRRPTIHHAPAPGSIETPCCDKTITTLPIGDRLVFDRSRVTCGKETK